MDEFKLAPTPNQMSDEAIAKLFDDELKPAKAIAAAFDRIDAASRPTATVPELFFNSPSKRRRMEYAQVPVGHDLGWACWDPNEYDGDPAEGNTLVGYGKTQDAAYADWLNNREDERPPGRVIHSSPFEPPTVVDDYRDPDED